MRYLVFLLLILLCLNCCPGCVPFIRSLQVAVASDDGTTALPLAHTVLITEVYYDSYLEDDPDEYIKLYNPTNESVDITGWYLMDLEDQLTFPNHTLEPEASIVVARDASAYFDTFGTVPDFRQLEYGWADVPQMVTDNGIRLANSGDEVVLRNATHTTVDVLAYGASDYESIGWYGAPVDGVPSGCVLKRNIDEHTGLYSDTNNTADWTSLRIYRVHQSEFEFKTFSSNSTATCFVSPDSSYAVLVDALRHAARTLYLSVYEFTNVHLAHELVNASKRNVTVKVLLDGNPIGWNMTNAAEADYTRYLEAPYAEKYIANMLSENGSDVRFITSSGHIPKRYRWLHNKYLIIDNSTTVITTENWKYTGIPIDATYGNRGWGIAVSNREFAEYYVDVFFADFNGADIFRFDPRDMNYGPPPLWFDVDTSIRHGLYGHSFPGLTINGRFDISPLLAPDSALLQTGSIIAALKAARTRIYVEQLDCDETWGDHANLYLEECINAARRGVEVKLLMDGTYANSTDDKPDNHATMEYINAIAEAEGLDLEARIAGLGGLCKIHTKGIIVDDKVIISSINWCYNSVARNREAGVIIESSEAARYFAEVFFWDWAPLLEDDVGMASSEDDTEPFVAPWIMLAFAIHIAIALALLHDIRRKK